MNDLDSHARSRATVATHSLGRTLLVALLASVVPLLAMVLVAAAGVTVAFLAGAATGLVVTVARRRHRSRRITTPNNLPSVVDSAN